MLCKADADEVKVEGIPSTPSHRPLVLKGQVDTLPPQAKMVMTILAPSADKQQGNLTGEPPGGCIGPAHRRATPG